MMTNQINEEFSQEDINKFFNAIIKNDIETIKQFLNRGFDVEKTYKFTEGFQYEEDGVKYDATFENVSQPIVWAAIRQKHEALSTILDNKEGVNVDASYYDTTALLEVARYGYLKSVEILIDHNANVNAIDEHGDSPLIRAARFKNKDVVKLLLAKKNIDVNHKNEDGETALSLAKDKEYTDIEKLLIDHGAVSDMDANNHDSVLIGEAE